MAYRSLNYASNPIAPPGKWVCAPGSRLGPFDLDQVPAGKITEALNYCGQCVSYVKQVCPSLPPTILWTRGDQVKSIKTKIEPGTVIATFNSAGRYHSGHAAIYVSHGTAGINVYDQFVTPADSLRCAANMRTDRWRTSSFPVKCVGATTKSMRKRPLV